MKEFSQARVDQLEYQALLEGEHVTLRPRSKSEYMLRMMSVDKADDFRALSLSQAQMEYLEDCLDRSHRKTRTQPGHGRESVEGCQACRMYDRLESGEVDLEQCQQLASWLVGEISARPTGQHSD